MEAIALSLVPPEDVTRANRLELITRIQDALGYDAESARHILEVI